MDTTLSDPLVGRLVDGRYQVASRIARGGMATVYLATDNRLDREVALKVMHPHLVDDQEFVSRFHREAKSAARMSHPNVVAVYDQGSDGPTVYLAMELIRGRTLRQLLVDVGPLNARESLEVLDSVLDALGAAHRAGIVHRDVKPENVLLTEDGRVKVADFGLARAATTSTSGATKGVLMGTVAYLSPELVSRGVADARSDVYAAGILLFEMLTGRQPFTGETPIQVAYQHVNSGVPAPSSLDPGIADVLDDLVLWSTARDPDERPADAADMLRRVRTVRTRLSAPDLDRDPTPRPVPDDGPSPAPAQDDAGATISIPREAHALALPVGESDGSDTLDPLDAGDPGDWGYGPGGSRRRKGLIALVGLLAAALVLGLVGWFLMAGPGAYTTTPDVVGRTADEARATLAEQGLEAELVGRYDEEVPKDSVIRTDPSPGGDVRKSGTVQVFVSQGSAYTQMPEVAGLSRDDAAEVLAAEDLTLGEVKEEYSETVPAGVLLSQAVTAGEQVKRTTSVDVVVSRGREPLEVPDVVGTQQPDAAATLQEVGLKAQVTGEFSETIPRGVVISQSPVDGTLFRGDPVTLVVSQGPPLVEVPGTRGKQVAEATQILEAAGFTVKVERLVSGGFNTVLSSSPGAGEQAPGGSVVTLRVV